MSSCSVLHATESPDLQDDTCTAEGGMQSFTAAEQYGVVPEDPAGG